MNQMPYAEVRKKCGLPPDPVLDDPKYAVFRPTLVEFDGVQFDATIAQHLPFLRIAYDARRGDKVAIELLTVFRVTIPAYWPMEAEPDAIVEAR